MTRPLAGLVHHGYKHIAKPVMFRFAPDDVHEHITKLGVHTQKSRLARGLLSGALAYSDPILETDVAGLHFLNPVGLSAGFDKNFELAQLMKAVGFGFMEGGSMTFRPCAGNARPWFYRLPKTRSLVVHAGLGNHGAEASIGRIGQYPAGTFDDFPLNISVAKTNSPQACTEDDAIEDYIGSLQMIAAAKVGHMVTLNISCPNTFGGEPFTTPRRLSRLLDAVDAMKLTQPVFLKMPGDLGWARFSGLVEVAARHSVAGLTMTNLAKDRSKMNVLDPLPATIKGNMSGMPTQARSDELIAMTRRVYGDRFVIIGVGGIFSAEDAYRKIVLGADLVELITGMIFEGPQLIGQINHGIAQRLRTDGFASVAQAVGSAL